MTKFAHLAHAAFHALAGAANMIVLLSSYVPDPYKAPLAASIAAVQAIYAAIHLLSQVKTS